jgi:hypothetical protein
MPSNLLDDFLQGIDPIDAATLLAGIRNSVPLGMLFRSGELGPEEMTELNAVNPRRAPAAAPAMDPAESNRRAQMDFEMQYPDPRIRELLIAEMLKQSRDPYSKVTATRRRDFEEAPMRADQFMSAAPKKKKFSKGGSMKKTLDEMQAEIARKLKPQPQPDLSRRKFFGLGKAEQLMPFDSAMQLNKKDPAFQEALALYMHDNRNMFKNAPAVTEKTVTVDPGKGAAKSTLKSISETPMSRREVLQSAAGQVMRGVLPDLGGLGAMGKVAKAVESVAPKAAPLMPETLQGLIAHFAKKGFDEDDTIKKLEKLGYDEDDVMYMLNPMRNPDEFVADLGEDAMSPARALSNLINSGIDKPPMTMRGPLREIKRENLDMYKDLIRAARDISDYGFE